MKRIALLFFLLITLWGCDKKTSVVPIVEQPPVIVQPKVELTISPSVEVLPYGSDVTVSWKGTNSQYCLYNGIKVENSGTETLKKLLKDTPVSVKSVNGNLTSDLVTKSVKVGDWTTSQIGLLTYGYFNLASSKVKQDGIVVFDSYLTNEQKTDKYSFTIEGRSIIIDATGHEYGNNEWKFVDETHIKIGDFVYLTVLTKDQLVLTIIANFKGKPSVYEDSYIRK